MKQPHDTQIGWQVLVRNIDELGTVAAYKGYDWDNLRTKLRAEGITPLIPQRDPGLRGWARNLLIYERAYHIRSNTESVFLVSVADTVIRSGRELGIANSVKLS